MRILVISVVIFLTVPAYSYDIEFNNGSEEDYSRAAALKGDTRSIQSQTEGLWPRARQGEQYQIEENSIETGQNEKFYIITTNNLPDHMLTTTNPNCASVKKYKFLIPKSPKAVAKPEKITKKMQLIGVALNGVVIAGPYDSQNKIAPYNRTVDLCSSHADPEGMYHYHFAPLCIRGQDGKQIATNHSKQIGWSFDGYQIKGLADRKKHLPSLDVCNGHNHDDSYHYHVTRDFPFFMGCYKAKPEASNFRQKSKSKSSSVASCPASLKSLGKPPKGKRPNFLKATKILGITEEEIKRALGPPPGDFKRASKKLGINEQKLRAALGIE